MNIHSLYPISDLKEQMTEFNESHEVEVQVDKDLDLI